MKLHLGDFFSVYRPGHPRQLDVPLDKPVLLRELLAELGIPRAEIHMVVVNGEFAELDTARVSQDDEVKIYPPVDGG